MGTGIFAIGSKHLLPPIERVFIKNREKKHQRKWSKKRGQVCKRQEQYNREREKWVPASSRLAASTSYFLCIVRLCSCAKRGANAIRLKGVPGADSRRQVMY
jgi:hypothetical protein